MAPIFLQQLVAGIVRQIAANKEGFSLDELSIQQLDDVERKLQMAASIIRGHRNSRQAINRLPPELLSMIFLETRPRMPSFLPAAQRGVYDKESRHWLSFLHVCRHWRGIIATCPLLWTTIDGGIDPKLFLRKSHPAPVDVFLGFRGPESVPFGMPVIKALKPHTSRLRQLSVNLSAWREDQSLFSVLNCPVPNLTSLTLIVELREFPRSDLPPIFKGVMPSLRKLALDHFTSWPPNYFTGLTHLCLCHQEDTGRTNTTEFLDFLESSPLLEELALIDAGPTRSNQSDLPPPAYDRRVVLDRLREVNFGDWPSMSLVSRLLSHLKIPATANLYIWGNNVLSSEDNLATFLPSDLSNLSSISNLQEMWIERFPQEWWHDFQFIIVANGSLYIWGPFTHAQLEPIITGFDLEQVRTLRLRDCCYFPLRLSAGFWRNLLDHLPSLRHLLISAILSDSIFARAVLSALEAEGDPDNAEEARRDKDTSLLTDQPQYIDKNTIVCPLLETLTIESVMFPTLYLDRLAEHRARQGYPISKLEIVCLDPIANGRTPGQDPDDDVSALDGEAGDLCQKDLGLLRAHVKEVFVDFNLASPTSFRPDVWPTRAYFWVRPQSVP